MMTMTVVLVETKEEEEEEAVNSVHKSVEIRGASHWDCLYVVRYITQYYI